MRLVSPWGLMAGGRRSWQTALRPELGWDQHLCTWAPHSGAHRCVSCRSGEDVSEPPAPHSLH